MDSIVHQLLKRLTLFFVQELDFQVDILRYATEPEYAAQVLDLAMETGHPEMCRLSGQIRERQLMLFSLHAAQAASAPDSPLPPPAAPAQPQTKPR